MMDTKTELVKLKDEGDRMEKSYAGENLFQCDQCDKEFANKGELTVHLRIHSNQETISVLSV